MADAEHTVEYRAVADFTNLTAEAAKAEQTIKRLGDTHSTANEKIAQSEGKVNKALDERAKANQRVGQSESKLAKDTEAHAKAEGQQVAHLRAELDRLRGEIGRAKAQLAHEIAQREQRYGPQRESWHPNALRAVTRREAALGAAESSFTSSQAAFQQIAARQTPAAPQTAALRAEQAASTATATSAAGRAEAAARRAEAVAHEVRTVQARNLKPGMVYAPGSSWESEITRVAPGDDGMQVDLASGKTLHRSPRGRVKVGVPVKPATVDSPAPRPAGWEPEPTGLFPESQVEVVHKIAGPRAGHGSVAQPELPHAWKDLFDAKGRSLPEAAAKPAVKEAAGSVVEQATAALAEELPKAAQRKNRPGTAAKAAAEAVAEVTPEPARPAKRADYRRLRSVDEDALLTALTHASESDDGEEYDRLSRALDAKLRARQRVKPPAKVSPTVIAVAEQEAHAEESRRRAAQVTPQAVAAAEEQAHAEESRRRASNSPQHYRRLGLVHPDALSTAFSHMSEQGDVDESTKLLDGMDRAERVQNNRAKRAAFLREFHAEIDQRFNQAEDATNGYMLNRRGLAKGLDPKSLFHGPTANVDKYASEELTEWFQKNGRLTLADYHRGMRDRRPEKPKINAPAQPVDPYELAHYRAEVPRMRERFASHSEGTADQRATFERIGGKDRSTWYTTNREHLERAEAANRSRAKELADAEQRLTELEAALQSPADATQPEPDRTPGRRAAVGQVVDRFRRKARTPRRARTEPAKPEINADDYITVVEPVIDDLVAKAVEAKQTRRHARQATPADIAARVRRSTPGADIAVEATGKAQSVGELTDAEARQEAGSHKLADAMAHAARGLREQRQATVDKIPAVHDLVDAEHRETTGNRHLADGIREVVLAKQRHEIADKRLQEVIDTGTVRDTRRAKAAERQAYLNLDRAEKQLRVERAIVAEQNRKDFTTAGHDDRAIAAHIDEQGRKADKHDAEQRDRERRLTAAQLHDQETIRQAANRTTTDRLKGVEVVRQLAGRAAVEEEKAAAKRLANAKRETDDHLLVEQLELRTAKMRHDHATLRVLDELKIGAVRTAEARREAEEVRRAERHTASQELQRVRVAAARPRNSGSIWRRGGGYRDRSNLGAARTVTGMGSAGKLLAQGWRDTEASGRLLERTLARVQGAMRNYRTETTASGDGGLILGRGMHTMVDWGDRLTSSLAGIVPKLLSFRGLIVLALAALGPLVSSLGALGAGAIGVISAIGGLAGVVLALPGAFAAAAASVGALMLAIQPMAAVFKAYNAYQDATRQGSLQMADGQRRAAEQLVDSQHGVQQASIGLQQAQFNERRAQVALNEARRQAARDLQDLRAEIERVSLNEEGAVLALKRAEADYRKVLADGNATQLDRQEALNRVKNAEFDLRDVRLKNQRLVEDAAIAEKRGVDGSLQVVDARNAAETATQNVSDAVFQLAKAQRDLTQAMRESAAGGSAAYTAYMKLQDELNKLGPNARAFALGLISMGGALRKIKENVGEAFFGPLLSQLGNLKSLLDPSGGIAYLLNMTAGALGNVAANAVAMVKRWQDSGDLTKIADSNAISVGNLGNAALYVADALERIAVISGPFLEWLTGAVERVAARFDKWTASASGVDTINRLLGIAKTRLQEFWDIAGNVFSLLGSLFFGSQTFTTDMMGGITKVTEGWAKWGKEQEKPNSSFQNFLKNTKPLLKDIVDFVGAFAKSLGTLAADPKNIQEAQRVFKSLAKDVLPALVGIFTKLSESKAFSKVIAGLGDFLKAVDKFLENGGITPLETFIDTLLKAFAKLFELLGNKTFGKTLSALLTGLATLAAVSIVMKVTGLSKLAGQLGKVTKGAVEAVGAVGKFAAFLGRQTFKGLDRLSGGRLGRAGSAVAGRVRRGRDAVTDRVRGRAPGVTANLRNNRTPKPRTGSVRDRLTDRVTGRRPGTTSQYRSLRTPEARAVSVGGKLDIANGLLRRIERNTAGGPGGGRGSRQRGNGPGPSGPGGRARRGGNAPGPIRPSGSTGRQRRGGPQSEAERIRRVRANAGQSGGLATVNARLASRRAALGAPEQRRQAVIRRAARNRVDPRTDIAERRQSVAGVLRPRVQRVDTGLGRSATAIPGYSSQRERDYRNDYRRRRAANDPILDLEETPSSGARGSRGRAMDRLAATRSRPVVATMGRRRRTQTVPDVEPARSPVARNTPAYWDLTATERQQTRRRDQRTRRRQRDQSQRRAQADQVRADRLRRRALSGIDEANTGLIGGIGNMLRGTGSGTPRIRLRDRVRSGATRTTGFLRGIGQATAARYRQVRGNDPERGSFDFSATPLSDRLRRAAGAASATPLSDRFGRAGAASASPLSDRFGRAAGAASATPLSDRLGGRRAQRGADVHDEINRGRPSRTRGFLRGIRQSAVDRYRRVRGDDPERGSIDLSAARRPATTQASATRRRLRRPSIGGTVGVAGLALGGYAMWDSWFGSNSPNDPQPALDENGDPILDANGQPIMEQPQGSGGLLGAVGGIGGAAFLGLDALDMGSGVADLFGGRGDDEDGTRSSRSQQRAEQRAQRRAAQQEARATRSAGGRAGGRAGSRLGRLAGRAGGGRLGRLGRAGGSVGRLAGRAGLGRLAGFGGRLLKGGGPVGIVGAVAGLAADSGLFGGKGSAGKQLGQIGGAALTGAGIGATIGSVVPVIGTGVGAAVGAVAGAGYSLFKDKGLRDRIGGLATSAGKWINEEIAKPVERFFSGIGRKVTDTAKSAGKWVYDHTARPVLGFFRDLGRWFTDSVIRPVRRAVAGILDWLTPFWEIFKGIGLFLADVQAKAVQWVYDNVIQPLINFLVGIGQWVAARATAVGGWVEDHLIGPIVNFFVSIGRWVGERVRAIGSWVEGNLIQPVVNFFVGIGRWIGARIAAIGGWVENNVVGPAVNFLVSIGRWFASLPGRVGGWVSEHIIGPIARFFSTIGSFLSRLPARAQHWAHTLPYVGRFIPDNPDGAYASGGEIAGPKDGRSDNLRILATAGEFMVRKRAVDQPGMRAHLDDINNGRFDPAALYAGLNTNVTSAMLPVNAPVRAVANTTITNTNTRNAGLSIGDVTINNPVRERSDRSLRRSLQTLAYTQDR